MNIIGINPFVYVPAAILENILREAGKTKSPVRVHGTVNRKPYRQTLVRYSGEWRLYINTGMLKDSPKRTGEIITVTIAYDNADRSIAPHPHLVKALAKNIAAKRVFDQLPPSRKKEIVRYISALKTEDSIHRNVQKAIEFLSGKSRFVGRDKP